MRTRNCQYNTTKQSTTKPFACFVACILVVGFVFQILTMALYRRIHIHQLAFSGLNNVEMLFINEFKISSPTPLINIHQTLVALIVKNGDLSSMPDTYFSECTKLKELILSHNHLSTIPDLSGVSDTLVLLMLNHNRLTEVKPLQDLNFQKLQYIYLEHNQIQHVDIDHFRVPGLLGLDLSHNLLQDLGHPTSLMPFSDREHNGEEEPHVELNLAGNPWHCNGNLSWVVSASTTRYNDTLGDTASVYLHRIGSMVRVMKAQAMLCHSPPGMRGKPVMHASEYWSILPSPLD